MDTPSLIKQKLEQIQSTNTLTPDVVFRSSYLLYKQKESDPTEVRPL